MWAVQPRFERDMHGFMEHARELGFAAVEVNHSMDAAMSRAAARGPLPVTAVHAPAPLERDPALGWNRDLNLAATDERERTAAVAATRRSIDLAATLGAPRVVVHLGHIGAGPLPAEAALRARYAAGERPGPAATDGWRAAAQALTTERARRAAPHLAQAARSLDALCAHAAARGVTVGLECRLHVHEIPLPREAATLLAPYPPAVAGYWHDVGHAEVLARLGVAPVAAWFRAVGPARVVGAHLHDVRGLVDHRAPGNGDVDFSALAAHLPPGAARTCEIDQREPDAAVGTAVERLAAAGLVAAPPGGSPPGRADAAP